MEIALISLGSNAGDRRGALDAADARLQELPNTRVLRSSDRCETAPVGGPAGQETFLNAATLLETALDPATLLHHLQRIETELGRVRTLRWGPRTIDLDICLFGDRIDDSPTLQIPHPRFAFRRFVLQPAAEIAPDLIYPINGWSVRTLLTHLDRTAPVILFVGRKAEELMQRCGKIPRVRCTTEFESEIKLQIILAPADVSATERRALDALRRRPDSPPALWLTTPDLEICRDEVLAAVAAME